MPTIFKTIIPYEWDLPSGYKTRSPADSDDVGESRRAFRFCLFKKLFEAYFASYFLEERDLKAKVKHCVIKFSLWATFKKLQYYLTHKKVSFVQPKLRLGDGTACLRALLLKRKQKTNCLQKWTNWSYQFSFLFNFCSHCVQAYLLLPTNLAQRLYSVLQKCWSSCQSLSMEEKKQLPC